MAISPSQRPDDNSTTAGSTVAGTDPSSAISGTRDSSDPTNEPGQYPPGNWANALFGGPQPTGTGAPGTQGAHHSAATDPTNQPGQLDEGLSGLGPSDTADTGAPGTSTPGAAVTPLNTGGPDTVSYTRPGSFGSGTYQSDTVQTSLSGPEDSTQANSQGYATGGPQLPGIAGNEPEAGRGRFQPGSGGRVLRGGRAVRG